MAKYGTFKYKLAKYGSYAVLRTSIQLKNNYKLNSLLNMVLQIEGRHRFRISANNGPALCSNTVAIPGQISKFRIKSDKDNKYIICERKILD
jgi:uncharacterized protein YegP (UPF0339 family)